MILIKTQGEGSESHFKTSFTIDVSLKYFAGNHCFMKPIKLPVAVISHETPWGRHLNKLRNAGLLR